MGGGGVRHFLGGGGGTPPCPGMTADLCLCCHFALIKNKNCTVIAYKINRWGGGRKSPSLRAQNYEYSVKFVCKIALHISPQNT